VASLRRDGEHIETTISDTGVGITPEFLPFVFEPFRQAMRGSIAHMVV
jgi:signal transduction histidine kinase